MHQKSIGTRITNIRKGKGYTQNDVVEKCNINIRTLQRIESDQVQPRPYTLREILKALDYDYDAFCEVSLNSISEDDKVIVENEFFDRVGSFINQNKSIMTKTFFLLCSAFAILFITNVATTDRFIRPEVDNELLNNEEMALFQMSAKKAAKRIKGTWKMKASTDLTVNEKNTRIMTFKSNGEFSTTNADGSYFNSGRFYFTNDGKLITIHYKYGKVLREVSNYYKYSIDKDKLIIEGLYVRPLSVKNYETFPVNEVWERIK